MFTGACFSEKTAIEIENAGIFVVRCRLLKNSFQLDVNSEEFKFVSSLFHSSMTPTFVVRAVNRVENTELWHDYTS